MTKTDQMLPEWLANHLDGDPATLLQKAVTETTRLELAGLERYRWLVAMDDILTPCALQLKKHYADARRLPSEEESRQWNAGASYHETISTQLTQLLRGLGDRSIPVTEAPAMVARILRHRGCFALWRYLRYEDLPGGWWLDTHKIFAFAEREQISNTDVLTEDSGQPIRIVSLYLQVLLLDTVNRTNLARNQIAALAGWLEQQADATQLERQYDGDAQLFFVCLDEDRGGRRIRNFEPAPNCRYWRTDALLTELEFEIDKLDSHQSHTLDRELIRQMLAEWSRTLYKRQRRSTERNDVDKKAYVAHGIYAVCQEVHSQAQGSTKTLLDGECWKIENESLSGFGALVNASLNTWLKVGRLITLREEMNFGMSVVAVVRSLKQQDQGKVYVGAEVLSYLALYAQLQEWQDNAALRFPGLFLSADEERGLPSSLLIPQGEYRPETELQLRFDRRSHHVRLGEVLEQKDDWCRVAIEVLAEL